MLGLYWALNIILALIQAVIALALLAMYIQSVRALGGKASKLLLALSSLLAFQGVVASISYYMLSGTTGPEVAIPLLPVTLLGVLVAGTLFYIVSR
ncbi:MAG: hypothetical protein F7B17_00080 [Desulfurococcales archaeon]|nr:hypothetical protein [Desulfurococcales archaeon]